MKRILITSALPYANGYLHLGHCAGAYLPADLYARYLRLKGAEVLWVCGSDEHGVAITIAADKEKVTPKEIIDKYHEANHEAFDKFGMTFDIYSRTSLPIHHQTAKEFFVDFLKKDLLSEKEEEQFYDEKAQMFLPDRYVEGECPNCGYDKARGDQCDNCGAYYNQIELKNPRSLVSGDIPIAKKTTHWYMRFDKFQKFLEEYIESHKDDWKDNVLQQTRSWLRQRLTERAITRDLNWGVRLDDIPDVPSEKARGKVLYVWFEAVLGYISGTKEFFLKKTEDRENTPPTPSREGEFDTHTASYQERETGWEKWWKDGETRYIAFIGKDNIVFHTLIFPAILHAKGEYILPDNVPANEFLNLEGQKFSKSRNWSIDLRDFLKDFPEPQYTDALRYTLVMNLPETRDSDFTWKDFQSRNNNELASIFGNFVNRTLQFVHKNFNGRVPELKGEYKEFVDEWNGLIQTMYAQKIPSFQKIESFCLNENDIVLLKALISGIQKISENFDKFRFRDAVTETMNITRAANKYFNDEEPWRKFKSEPERCGKTLYVCCHLVKTLALLFAPITPFTSERINRILNEENILGTANGGIPGENYWEKAAILNIEQGIIINKSEILFTLIEDKTVMEQIEKLGEKNELVSQSENLISIDDFKSIKLRTAKVLEAENIKKSKKLLKLKVDLGTEQRQIIAGIAEHYKPEDLIGKVIVVVANLQPAKLMGEESNGMLLAANASDGKLSIIICEDQEIEPGAEVR